MKIKARKVFFRAFLVKIYEKNYTIIFKIYKFVSNLKLKKLWKKKKPHLQDI